MQEITQESGLNFTKLFNDFKVANDEFEIKKLRGLNDYNIYERILGIYDEVKLHSGFIHSFLDPDGYHYQKTLFLKKFLEICKIQNFDYENAKVYKEYKNIDIFITDGTKHIILENKIYAGEQKEQISRYIEAIKDENKCKYGDIVVLYLSLDKKLPTKYSLCEFELKDNFLCKGDGKIVIKAISYDREIREWLRKSKKEVANLTNLNFALSEYENIIKKLYGEYKMANADISKVIKENYKMAKTIFDEFKNTEREIVNEFLQKGYDLIKEKFDGEFKIETKEFQGRWARDLKIAKDDWKLYFSLEFNQNDPTYFYYGIATPDESIDCRDIEFSGKNKDGFKTTKWWVIYKWLGKNDNGQNENLIENIMFYNFTPENFAEIIVNFVNKYKDELDEINKNLKLQSN